MSERIANDEFMNWFEHWRAELKSRLLGEPTLREEGQVSPGHTNVRSFSETTVNPTKVESQKPPPWCECLIFSNG